MARQRKTLPKDFEEILQSKDLEAMKKVFDICEIEAYEDCPDVSINTYSGTALHSAVDCYNIKNIKLLLKYGAKINAKDSDGLRPLEYLLLSCANIHIVDALAMSKFLLKHNATKTEKSQKFVKTIGENFEFHRQNFHKDYVDSTSRALDELYQLFDVVPVPRRVVHKSEIDELKSSMRGVNRLLEKSDVLLKYAVAWVAKNSIPIVQEEPEYRR